MHHFIYTSTLAFCVAASAANAGFVVSSQSELYGGGVTKGTQGLFDFIGPGYHFDSVAFRAGSAGSRSVSKIKRESFAYDNVYKVDRTLSLSSDPNAPLNSGAGALALGLATLEFDTQTTIEISFEIEIDQGISSSHVFSVGELFHLEARESMSGSTQLTLAPGSYRIFDSIGHTIQDTSLRGEWIMSSLISITVIPAPAGTAMLGMAGLFATRRRR